MTEAPPREPVAVGSAWTVDVVRELTRSQIVQYAGASGDFNPLHTDEVYARQVGGYPSVFAHGMLTMGMTARAVTDVFGPSALRRFGGRFRAQVWPGDSLAVRIEVTGVGVEPLLYLTVVTANQHGIAVFDGTAEVEPAAVLTPPQVTGKLALPNDRLFVSEGMEEAP